MTKQTSIEPQTAQIPRFLIWTFAISWGAWAVASILNYLAPNILALHLSWFFVGTFGPAIGACLALGISWKDLPRFLFSGRKTAWLYLIIFSALLTIIPALASVKGPIAGEMIKIPQNILMVSLIGGGQEEPGWRGFLQPALEKKYSFPISSLTVGAIWAVWHLPLWFYDRGDLPFHFFFVDSLIFAFVFAGFYKKTRSVIACVLLHAFLNVIPGSFHGLGEFINFWDMSGIRPLILIGGAIVLVAYSVWLWYRTDRQDKESSDDKG